MKNMGSRIAGLLVALLFCLVAAPNLLAATLEVSEDSPIAFRASFKGTDTDPSSINGNDFQVFTGKFWTVLVNLRCDGLDGYGNAFGFYEIQLTHTGSAVTDPTAPLLKTFLFYVDLAPNVVLTDSSGDLQPHEAGSEFLSTVVKIRFDPSAGRTTLNGTIAGDCDLDGNGIMDSEETSIPNLLDILQDLQRTGDITGREMGQIIQGTKKGTKKP